MVEGSVKLPKKLVAKPDPSFVLLISPTVHLPDRLTAWPRLLPGAIWEYPQTASAQADQRRRKRCNPLLLPVRPQGICCPWGRDRQIFFSAVLLTHPAIGPNSPRR